MSSSVRPRVGWVEAEQGILAALQTAIGEGCTLFRVEPGQVTSLVEAGLLDVLILPTSQLKLYEDAKPTAKRPSVLCISPHELPLATELKLSRERDVFQYLRDPVSVHEAGWAIHQALEARVQAQVQAQMLAQTQLMAVESVTPPTGALMAHVAPATRATLASASIATSAVLGQDDVLSVVLHELRTPLTSIAGALDIVLNNYPQSVGTKAKRYIGLARDGCTRLHNIVDELLDAARLERGPLELDRKTVFLDEVAADTIEKLRPAAERRRIHVELVVGPASERDKNGSKDRPALRALLDAARIGQMISNLLSNAIRYVPEGGRIEVQIFGASGLPSHIGLSMWNNGPAIPEEAHERIFEKFGTAEPTPVGSAHRAGTGLGLTIARTIVEHHGGALWIDPTPVGARFVATLPCSAAATPETILPASQAAKRPLLLITVPGTHAFVFAGVLRQAGWLPIIASTPDEAFTLVRERRPEIVILDLSLPSEDSSAVLEVLRHDPETKAIPVLALRPQDQVVAGAEVPREANGTLDLPTSGEALVAICDQLVAKTQVMPSGRVLVVDDDPSIRTICREILEQAGFAVDEAPDGLAALEATKRVQPDVMVLDLMIPHFDGFEVVRRLQATESTKLPIILLSARSQTQDKLQAFQAGAEDYLVKPFDHAELVMRVEKAIERRKREAMASPSTRLPGSNAIEDEIARRLSESGDFAFCYVDLDHLKAYNDTYGYAKADGVIRQVGDILREVVAREGKADDFVGHIAGDDFVLLTTSDRVDHLCQCIIQMFDRVIPYYYDRKDRDRGFIEAVDRYGAERRFPFLSLSVAALTRAAQKFRTSAELARRAADEKRRAKEVPGSSYVRDGQVLVPAKN